MPVLAEIVSIAVCFALFYIITKYRYDYALSHPAGVAWGSFVTKMFTPIRRYNMFNLFAFVSYVFVSCITPGPNNIMSMSNGTRYGVKQSMPFCAGVATGFLLILLGCIGCNLVLYQYIPNIVEVMTYLGAIYIFYLAWVIWRDKPKEKKKKSMQLNPKGFFTAVVLQFVNPKGLLFGMTLISNFVFPYFRSAGVFVLVLLFNWIVVFFCCGCWVLFGSVFQRFFETYRRLINGIMALLLVYCGVSLFL